MSRLSVLGVVLSSWVAASSGRYALTADTAVDTVAGLTWQRNEPAMTYSQASAVSYCQTLMLAGGGWRLPTIKELQTLVDVRSNPTIDQTAFPGSAASFWSSTPYIGTPGDWWRLSTSDGSSRSSTGTNLYKVRCVR